MTQIYHPNVTENGDICKDIIGEKAWIPKSKFITVIHSLISLMSTHDLSTAINVSAVEDIHKGTFNDKARECTQKFAV